MKNRVAAVLAALLGVLLSSAQTVKYSDLAKGGKLPYGKNVTLTGDLSDLKCGAQQITDLLTVTGITASYLGQAGSPGAGTISGNTWSAPLGSLPADTAVNLQLKVTGKIVEAKKSAIVDDLFASDQFHRSLQAFFQVSKDQGPSVVTEEATRLLRDISDQNGALTTILRRQLSCVAITDVSSAAVTGLRANLPAFLNLNARLGDLMDLKLEGLDPHASLGDAYRFITGTDFKVPDNRSAQNSVNLFKRDYEAVSAAFQGDVFVQLSEGVQLDTSTVTADLSKYAGFDAGAGYVPRINELRSFFMVHIYPWGPVELDTGGLLPKDWKKRFSISVGMSIGDISGNTKSRIKAEDAFAYGLGCRINKYFRISIGGVVYRDSGTGGGLLNEAFIAPSIDLTALPGLKQIFASASSGITGTSGSSPDTPDNHNK